MSDMNTPPLLSVRDLVKHFPVKKGLLQRTVGQVHAVDGISFDIAEGETLGLVGESGCGKSTAGKTILKLIDPTAGEIRIRGERIDALSRREMRPYRRQLQVVFQDPYSSLNPRLRIRDIIGEPLINYGVFEGLTIGGAPTQLLEERAERVQLRAKASPVTGFQLFHSGVVVTQRLPRPIGLGAGERGFGRRPRRRGGCGRGGGSGFFEERGQRAGERLVHDHMVAIRSEER